ncbi:M3 family metallopeptidase [Polyangium mundeleinium]|uniref:M3 family metallopeptidase n=1 Tax=Polyangium mundeleinium TaxID=2995306 RepID=A0ABT5EM54_9BACT|nr:M3 family metallopeptidase [Polyangium mundeleinium]MDC0742928.1 M3 family metallopeptidase [Polyangium mundeleinium]
MTTDDDLRWDLSALYRGLDDVQIDEDLRALIHLAEAFARRHRGTLATTLGAALQAQEAMSCLVEKLTGYLFLRRATDAADLKIQQRIAQIEEAWSRASAQHLGFFEHELVAIDEQTYADLIDRDEVVRRHRPLLDHARGNRAHLLAEPVERALALRQPFGPGEWSDHIEEVETTLRFTLDGESLALPGILHVLTHYIDGDTRARALALFSEGLTAQGFDRLMARGLNVVIGAKIVEDSERGYASPMSARNIDNRVDDATVEALHDAVAALGIPACRRYYRLLAAHLGASPLRWSDRNAASPITEPRQVPWIECLETVRLAYGSLSPTLADLVDTMLKRRWVDVPPAPGKIGGAFNCTIPLPDGDAGSYSLLNYLGSMDDVMTVAHELGHGVHGILAARAQGARMFRAPTIYAETASIFGEMATFQHLLDRADTDAQRLALLMRQSNAFVNTVVRQICLSSFERKIHQLRQRGKLTVDEINESWMHSIRAFYGEDGDVFTYANVDNLWSYITHFLRPFYVYSYAFGQLFSQALYAARDRLGDDFEDMYLELLRSGGTRDAVSLMRPFGLDPRAPSFWRDGITSSIDAWLDEAEAISRRLGIEVVSAVKPLVRAPALHALG